MTSSAGASRLWSFILRYESAILEATPGGPVFGCQCPWCTARGQSVVDDEAGRFISCLVCGTSGPRPSNA